MKYNYYNMSPQKMYSESYYYLESARRVREWLFLQLIYANWIKSGHTVSSLVISAYKCRDEFKIDPNDIKKKSSSIYFELFILSIEIDGFVGFLRVLTAHWYPGRHTYPVETKRSRNPTSPGSRIVLISGSSRHQIELGIQFWLIINFKLLK